MTKPHGIFLLLLGNALICLSYPVDDIEDLIPVRSPITRIRSRTQSRQGKIPLQRGFPGKEEALDEDLLEIGRLNEGSKSLYQTHLQFNHAQKSENSARLKDVSGFQDDTFTERTLNRADKQGFVKPSKHPFSSRGSLRKLAEEPQTNRHKKEEFPVREEEEEKGGLVEEEWREPGLLGVIADESPSVTGFPRQLKVGQANFKRPAFGQELERQASNQPSHFFGQQPQTYGHDSVQSQDLRQLGQHNFPQEHPQNLGQANTQLFGQAHPQTAQAMRDLPTILSRFGTSRPGDLDSRRVTTTTTPRPEWWSAENAKYSFSSDQQDSISDLTHSRSESRSGGTVKGSYSYSDGYVLRTVQYIADKDGYRVLGENSTPLSADGPVVDPSGRAAVQADVDGNGYNYVVRGEDVYRPRFRTRQQVQEELSSERF